MQIDVGCFYFIKDSFFDVIDDPELMQNKESGSKRPCYYCFKSKEYDNKLQKQIKLGKKPSIDTIVFGNVANIYSAFLIQNMFPVTEEYIESQYIKNKVAIKLSNKLQTEIILNHLLKL